MTTKSKAKSQIFEAVHETVSDLHRLGFIDKRKMRKFDVLCLDPIPAYDSEKIRALRDHLQLSQAFGFGVEHQYFDRAKVGDWRQAPKRPLTEVA